MAILSNVKLRAQTPQEAHSSSISSIRQNSQYDASAPQVTSAPQVNRHLTLVDLGKEQRAYGFVQRDCSPVSHPYLRALENGDAAKLTAMCPSRAVHDKCCGGGSLYASAQRAGIAA